MNRLGTEVNMELETNSDRPLAVVTGASSGIGYELAKQFAQHGFDLVLVSKNPAVVEAAQICERLGATVDSFIIDLARSEGVSELIVKIEAKNKPVEAIAINVGIEADDELDLINLNIVSSVHLAKHIVKDMVNRKKGRILFTSSIMGIMPSPFQAVYGASEAFIQSYSEALRAELKDKGVTVTALMPGPTDAHFFDGAALLAQQGFEAMMAGKGDIKVEAEAVLSKFKTEESKAETHRKSGEPARLKH
jgi:short-subunit dehydrogenase